MKTSRRLDRVKPSLTLEMDARAKRYRAEGRDVLSLAAGEPDFTPPDFVVRAAVAAVEEARGRYTAVSGAPDLREAIVERLAADWGLDFATDEILVSSGAKQSLFNSLYALCDEGDEVLIPAPYWTSYPEMAHALGITPVICPTRAEDDFRLHGADVARRITPKTRALLLNSPSNPTGRVMRADELREVAAAVADEDIWIISDDIYAHLIFDETLEFANVPMLEPAFRDRTIVVNGMSKTYCMTGWRIGYAAGPREVIRAMATIQSHSTSCANAIAQIAATAALRGTDPDHLESMVREYARRSRFVHEVLSGLEGVTCPKPQGTFYAFPSFAGCLGRRCRGRIVDSPMTLASILLEEFLVAVVPGEAFGDDASIRVSYACSMESLERAMERISQFHAELESP